MVDRPQQVVAIAATTAVTPFASLTTADPARASSERKPGSGASPGFG